MINSLLCVQRKHHKVCTLIAGFSGEVKTVSLCSGARLELNICWFIQIKTLYIGSNFLIIPSIAYLNLVNTSWVESVCIRWPGLAL